MVSHIYTNLPVSDIVRLPHPRSGDSQGQETFLAPSADKQTRGNISYTPSNFPKTVLIKVYTRMASCDINTVLLKISLYAQWLSEYSCSQTVAVKIHTQKRLVAILIQSLEI